MRRTFQSHSSKTHAGNFYSGHFKARYMLPGLDSSPVLELNGSMEPITKGTYRSKWSLGRSLCYKFKSLNSRPNLHRCLDWLLHDTKGSPKVKESRTQGWGVWLYSRNCLLTSDTACTTIKVLLNAVWRFILYGLFVSCRLTSSLSCLQTRYSISESIQKPKHPPAGCLHIPSITPFLVPGLWQIWGVLHTRLPSLTPHHLVQALLT